MKHRLSALRRSRKWEHARQYGLQGLPGNVEKRFGDDVEVTLTIKINIQTENAEERFRRVRGHSQKAEAHVRSPGTFPLSQNRPIYQK